MSDLDRFLRNGVGGFDPSPEEGLEATRRRVERRQRRRRFIAGSLTVAMFGATLAGAVWLGDRSRRPIAGPTPTASPILVETPDPAPAPSPPPELGTDTCQGPFFGDVVCVEATSDVIVIGSGRFQGVAWALYAWTGRYIGPRASLPGPQPDAEMPVLCTAWLYGELHQPRCERTAAGDTWSLALVEMPGIQRGFLQESSALKFPGSSGWFETDPRKGSTAVWSWTPKETARITFTGQAGAQAEAELFGPVPRLENGMKWFVAFLPSDAGPLAAKAVDEAGELLWHEAAPSIRTAYPPRRRMSPTSPVENVAGGTYEGGDWELFAYTAVERPGGVANLCFRLVIHPDEDPVGGACTRLGELAGGALGLDTDGGGPLPGFVYGFTPPDTGRVELSEGGVVREASLYPSPGSLAMEGKFFVGFTPRVTDVAIRAYDSAGEELWTDEHPYHPD